MGYRELLKKYIRHLELHAGDNFIEVSRTGGTGGSWIQFDFVRLEVDTSKVVIAPGR